MRLSSTIVRLLLPFVLVLPAQALVVEGQTFDDTIRLSGTELRLNGVGLRAVAWAKGYAAGLYLSAKATTVPQVLAASGPKRLQMRMLVEVETEEFVKAFNKGIARNTPPAEQPPLAARMQEFERAVRAIGRVKKGDVIDLDWLPQRGMQLALNGKPRGAPIAGEDFYAALLRIFIGQRPVDPEMKIGLLGGPVS